MANDYYAHVSGFPATNAAGRSADMRSELDLIDTGFAKLPQLTGNAFKIPYVTAAGAAWALVSGNGLLNISTSGIPTVVTISAFGQTLIDDASASDARTTLGLGTIATQASSNVSITGGSITGITDLAVADGGTGASDASTARTNLGLGTIATQASSNVSITGGSITGITDLAVADGGTGASDAATARSNLGLGTIATQAANNVSITGGSITGITDLAVADGGTGASDASTARTNLGLGTAATQNTGTSGANVPLMNGANTWSATQTISSGNLAFSGTAQRITLDTVNATVANRTIFQDKTTNATTNVQAMPNGTGGSSSFVAFGGSDPDNSSFVSLTNSGSATTLASTKTGTGTAAPIVFSISGTSIVNIATDGTVTFLVNTFGYGAGAGGTVTQLTSKSTAVTLNKPSGQITTNNAALAGGASVNFVLNNSFIGSADVLVVVGKNANYLCQALSIGTGAAQIRLTNITGGSLSDAVAMNFVVIKASTT